MKGHRSKPSTAWLQREAEMRCGRYCRRFGSGEIRQLAGDYGNLSITRSRVTAENLLFNGRDLAHFREERRNGGR